MASELLSLADASVLLGVSSERVRQLVVAGDLPGVRFGNAWAVPRDAIDARRHASNRKGRRLSARRAWESIADNDVDLSNVSRYGNRGDIRRYQMSSVDVAFVSKQQRAMVSGAFAAISYGEPLSAGARSDLYVSRSLHDELKSVVAAAPDQLGAVILRVVPDGLWSYVKGLSSEQTAPEHRVAPRAAVALDLMESGDPRHWMAAENLIDSRD
jgi:excisionase family DNA binding protein